MVFVLARDGDRLLNGSSSSTRIPGPHCHGPRPHSEFPRMQKDVLGFPGSARPESGLLELLLHSSDQIPKANTSPTLP